jgi:hypothetical protein
MRRHVGAFGEIAEIAEVTMIDYAPVILPGYTINLHGRGFVDEVEQGRE